MKVHDGSGKEKQLYGTVSTLLEITSSIDCAHILETNLSDAGNNAASHKKPVIAT